VFADRISSSPGCSSWRPKTPPPSSSRRPPPLPFSKVATLPPLSLLLDVQCYKHPVLLALSRMSMRCSNCGSENPTDSAFCEQCGRKLELLCPACKAPVSAGARFCRKCGASLSIPIHSEAIAANSSSGTGISSLAGPTAANVTDGERKTVTALFADLKGSTELLETLDPEEG